MSQAEADGPEVGSLGEETAKLFGAIAGWAREQDLAATAAAWTHRDATAAEDRSDEDDAPAGHHGPECRYCPVCRTVNAIRHVNPEARAHLAVAVTSFAKAAEALLRTDPPEPARPDVEKIDLDGWDEPAPEQ